MPTMPVKNDAASKYRRLKYRALMNSTMMTETMLTMPTTAPARPEYRTTS
jgi:hypothetical protein